MNNENNRSTDNGKVLAQIPNIFTLLNLFCGCIAILYVIQTGITLKSSYDSECLDKIVIPENICMASIFIGIAALIDFLDGFVARLLNASSEMGKQLDSLADVVSFGVAPGMIIYQFLRLGYAQQPDGLDINTLWLMPAFIVPCAGAYRLARFNIDTEQGYGFKGVPIPAVGLLIASFPFIYLYSSKAWIVLCNKWFWYAIIFIVSYLMVSKLPMLALKFKNATVKSFMPFIILAVLAIIAAFVVGWMAVPITFAAYVILSLVFKNSKT
jgi:CDP-diacylglycerol--serine O-phosphatidyltransferase